MAKKQKLLNLLTSVSVASIVASIGVSSGAFAADVVIGDAHTTLTDFAARLVGPFHDGDNIEFDKVLGGGGVVTLTVDAASGAAGNIGNITATHPGNIVIDRDIAIRGTIARGAGLGDTMTATINNNTTLTLFAGVNHTGLGAVTLNGATATLTLADNATVHNAIDGAANGQGILNLGVGSTLNEEIGGINSLATVNIGAGEVNINNDVSATDTHLIAGSVLKLAVDKTITGQITATAGNGTLTFLGAGEVTDNIGNATHALAEINITDPGAIGLQLVVLGGDVYTKKLHFGTGNEVRIAGNFGGGAKDDGNPGAAGEVDFGTGGALTFNGAVGDLKEFNATITNGDNGTLYVEGKLKAIHADIGKIHIINIGTAAVVGPHAAPAVPGFLTIDASTGNVDLLSDNGGAVQEINFLDAGSELRLLNTNAAGKTITFYGNLEGFAGNGGVLSLEGTGGLLTLNSDVDAGAPITFGATDELIRLDVRGQVTIAGRAINGLDIQHIPTLNVIKGAVFTDEGATSALIGGVHIGVGDAAAGAAAGAAAAAAAIARGDPGAAAEGAAAEAAAGATGAANYVLDAKYAAGDNLDILIIGHVITFEHQNAQLTLRNSDNADRTITLNTDLVGFDHATDKSGGIVLLENTGTGLLTLKSNTGGETLGTKYAPGGPGREIGQLRVSGQVTINGDGANAVDVSNAKALNVIKEAVFTDESTTSAKIANVHIGAAKDPASVTPADRDPGAAIYVLDAKYANAGNLEILSAIIGGGHNNIIFEDPNARLILRNSENDDRAITLANTLNPGNAANGKGIVELNSDVVTKTLTIARPGAQSLGTAGNKLRTVIFSGAGDLDIAPTIYANNITSDITGTVTTNTIDGNVNFTDATTLNIRGANNITGNVTFNAAGQLEGSVGGTVIFNAAGRLKGDVGGGVTFAAAGAELEGDVGGAVIFNAAGRLEGNVGGGVTFAVAGAELEGNVTNGGVIFAADGNMTGNVVGGVTVNAGVGTVGGTIDSVTFTGNGQLTANKGVAGDVDFNNRAGTVTVADSKTIGGNIKNGKDATLVFAGTGEVKEIKELKLLRVGAGNVKLLAGNYGITEIQGNGTQTLTFADKFNLKGNINKEAGGMAVNLIFEGSSTIDGIVGSDKSPVGKIQIKAGTVAFGDSINSKEGIEIVKGATTQISKNFTVKSIKGEGTVRFSNPQELILNIPIEVGTIEIAEGNIQATKKISAGNVLFSSSKEAILTLKEESIISNIETTGNGIHSLALNANLTIAAGNVGSESNRLKEIKLLGNHTISIIGNKLYSNISTANKNSGIVMFNSDDSVAHGNLGTNEFRLSEVTFDSDSTAGGDVYSKKITIKDKKTATFAGTEKRTIDVPGVPRLLKDFAYSTKIGSEEINAEGSSKIQFKSGALVEAPINGGEVILADNVWFKEKVTSAAPVTFAADKYAILEKDVKFASITANQAKIMMLGEEQTITGDLTAKDLTMDLGITKVKYGNTAKLTGELKLRSFYDSSKLAGGNIEIQSNGKLDLSQLDKLVVTIAGQTDISKIPDETEYVLISSVDDNGISLDPSKVDLEINEQSSFVSWTIDPNNLTLHAKDIHKQVIEKDVIELDEESAKTQDSDAASRLSDRAALLKQLNNVTDKDSDAYKYLGEIGLMDKDNRALAMDKLLSGNTTNPISTELALMVSEAISQVASQIASRSPVASGDDDKVTYGLWGSPFYAVGHQEMRKGISGYRSKSVGGIFGFDGLINDDLLVGVAYSKIDTKMFHKDLKFGDKTNGTTNLFSLYGSYKFPSNFFAEAVASYGITDVKNAEGRIVLDDNKKVTTGTAVAKYKSTSYSGQLLTGYNYQPSEKLTITPTIGLRYSQFMDDGHVQSGTAWQNLTVKKTSYNKLEGILGLRTATNIQLDQLLLIPELHGYVNYDFKGKSPKIDARLGGINEPLPTKSVKPAKVSFTVGTGLTMKSNMMEYGVTYNAHIADKYIGHQGSLKVKVNF
ncbi:MAG: autotransporter domain-containing protein [Rickettsia endosymbiont of Labidopullus appendiculatus]|nr:autotransporter domain-containing protein [Rickettsia endosymbiont of Labidopullus appendiculatus]